LPGNILKVSPIQTSAILQSTKELNVIFGAEINLNFGVVLGFSFTFNLGVEKKPTIKVSHEIRIKNCILYQFDVNLLIDINLRKKRKCTNTSLSTRALVLNKTPKLLR
jgi:hypothetical protein